MAENKFYVISYDIVDDRKRQRAAEALKDYGQRVQKSVYEVRLDARRLTTLLGRLNEIIDKDTDNVLVYVLCEGCVKQKRCLGLKIIGEEEDFRVL
jgi:CRISPR-associated protein Cas2